MADLSYKNAIMTEVVEETPQPTPERLLTYDELLEEIKKNRARIPKVLQDDIMTENIYEMHAFLTDIKDVIEEYGYMNSFSFKDTHDLCTACLTFEPVPEEVSDEEIGDDVEDYPGI